jgi:hypothetical protein
MTTRVHIVNFGPDKVEVRRGPYLLGTVYAQQSSTEYVYKDGDITIVEVKADAVVTAESLKS